LYIVFGLQAVLAGVIAVPLLAAVSGTAALGLLDAIGACLWLIGMFFEVVGDHQLARFKADADNRGKVLDKGLWRFTRHPNYFGEFAIWWGYFFFALAAGGWWAIFSPVLMSFLLLRVSGVALLERSISERRPEYVDYVRRTNAFFPGPPRVSA
jgi:steroid 5-alpha reductase family enzyme